MKLETSIRELHEMFMDMAMFVETQVMRHLPHRLVVKSLILSLLWPRKPRLGIQPQSPGVDCCVNAELKPKPTLPHRTLVSYRSHGMFTGSYLGRQPPAGRSLFMERSEVFRHLWWVLS